MQIRTRFSDVWPSLLIWALWLAFWLVLLPVAAHAQEVPAAAVADAPWWVHAIALGGTALGGLVLAAAKRLTDYLGEQTKKAWLGRLAHVGLRVVMDLYNAEVEHAKAAAADGKLTADERAEFRAIAVARLKAWFGPKGLKTILWAVGSGKESLDAILAAEVEAAVTTAQTLGRVVDPS